MPKPPMIAATKALSSGVKPMSGSTMPDCAAHSTPARPAKPEAMAKATTIRRLTSSPTSCAAPMSSAAARMPSPASVRVTNQPSKASATPVSTTVSTLICGEGDLPVGELDGRVHPAGEREIRGELVKIRMPRFSRM